MNRLTFRTSPAFASGRNPQPNPNWLRVVAAASPSEPARVFITGFIGENIWDDSGTSARQFREALAAIPKGQPILCIINSEGGSVQDALEMHNAIRERGGVTTRNVGYAASSGSLILTSGDRVEACAASLSMVHEPWGHVVGNADALRKAAEMMDKHGDVLVAAYARKTGKSAEEIRSAMKAETWFTGPEAKAFGLVDSICDGEADLVSAAIDPANFLAAPDRVVAVWNSRRTQQQPAEQQQTSSTDMNRLAILAALKKHGVSTTDTQTDAELVALLQPLLASGKVTLAEVSTAPQAAAQTAPATPTPATPDVIALAASVRALTEANDALRRQQAERDVDTMIAERRHPVAARDALVAQVVSGGAQVLATLRAYPAHQPGGEPLANFTVDHEDPNSVLRGIEHLHAPVAAWRRGESVDRQVLATHAREIGAALARNKNVERQVMAATTHTISADLKRIVILNGPVLRAFKRKIIALGSFSTVFTGVPFKTEGGLDVFEVPYYPLKTDASTNWDANNGYVYGGTTVASVRKITCDKRKYQPLDFESALMARQPFFALETHLMLMAEQLGVDVFQDVASVITKANFGVAGLATAADALDATDFIGLKTKVDRAFWPEGGRSAVLESGYHNALLADERVSRVDASGSDGALRRGVVGNVYGFDLYHSPAVPANSEGLVGWVGFLSAIGVGVSPVDPAPGVRAQLLAYEVVTDPDTGISFSYRYGGNAQMDRDNRVIEAAYGYDKMLEAGLLRIVDGSVAGGI